MCDKKSDDGSEKLVIIQIKNMPNDGMNLVAQDFNGGIYRQYQQDLQRQMDAIEAANGEEFELAETQKLAIPVSFAVLHDH